MLQCGYTVQDHDRHVKIIHIQEGRIALSILQVLSKFKVTKQNWGIKHLEGQKNDESKHTESEIKVLNKQQIEAAH